MEFTTNRRLAVIILAAVIYIFTFIGVNRSVSSLVSDIRDSFYSGVYNKDEGYTEVSIQSHLDNRIDAANGLCTMASGYSDLSEYVEALKDARYELMNKGTDDISGKYSANAALTEASEALYEKLAEMDLSKDEEEMLQYYISTLRGAESAIEKLSYNDEVAEFYEKTLKTFPVSVFVPIISVDGPEYFR